MSEEDNEKAENARHERDYETQEFAERSEQLEKLNEYVQQMAYKPIEPPLASERIESLAQTRKKNIVGTYAEHKDNLKPKERSARVGRIVSKYETITTEQLKEFIELHRKNQAKLEKLRNHQQVLYHQTLSKLQDQCKEQLMNAIVNKFAKKVVKSATQIQLSNLETESYQCLKKSLVCNMYLALKIPNDQQTQDYTIYNKLAGVLGRLILKALFMARKAQDEMGGGNIAPDECNIPEDNEKDCCLRLRSMRAAKKKLNHKSQGDSRHGCEVGF